MRSMIFYTKAAMERAMKVQEVILRAIAKRITWWQAAEIIGISDRQMRRWRERYEEFGFRGLFDRRRGKPSPKVGIGGENSEKHYNSFLLRSFRIFERHNEWTGHLQPPLGQYGLPAFPFA